MAEDNVQKISLDDRELAYLETGDSNGFPLFFAHGAPGTCLEGKIFADKAKEYGFRFISVERPGMGHTKAVVNRRMLDAGKDILALADKLGINEFGVMGWSGGGAPAIATAYITSPERLKFCMVCAGYTNLNFKKAYKLIPSIDRVGYFLSHYFPAGLHAMFAMLGFLAKRYPNLYLKLLSSSITGADDEHLKDPIARQLFLSDEACCFTYGAKGVAIDAKINYLPWYFDLPDVKNHVDIFHGTEDHFVPISFSKNSEERLPSAKLHELKDEGHLFPFHNQDMLFSFARKRLAGYTDDI